MCETGLNKESSRLCQGEMIHALILIIVRSV